MQISQLKFDLCFFLLWSVLEKENKCWQMKWWWIPLDKLLYSLSISDTTQCIVFEKQLWLLLGPGLTKCVNDMKGRWMKHNTDFPAVYLRDLIFVLATNYSWQKPKNPPNKSADYKRELQYAIVYVEEITNIWAMMIWSSSKW